MAIDQAGATTGDATMDAIMAEFGDRALMPGELSPEGDGQGTINNGMGLELMSLMGRLRARRAAMGLTVVQVARRAELSVAAVERLEGGGNHNPHFDLVWRYALAMDALPTLAIEEVEPGPEEIEERADE